MTNSDVCINCIFECHNPDRWNKNELDLLNKSKKEITFKKGETIVKQGSFINEIPFIQDGLVKLERSETNGREMVIDFVGAGTNLGLSLIDMEEAMFSIIALKDTTVCVIKATALKYLIKTNTTYSELLLNWYRQNSIRQFNRLYILGAKQMHGRLAAMLIYLNQNAYANFDVFEYITRKDLANISGMSVERMNHILNELKTDGLIESAGKGFIIKDMDKMEKLIRYS